MPDARASGRPVPEHRRGQRRQKPSRRQFSRDLFDSETDWEYRAAEERRHLLDRRRAPP